MLNYWQVLENIGRIHVQNASAMTWAVFYHDSVNTGAADDEAASCAVMRRNCPDGHLAAVVEELIMATACHQQSGKMSADMQIIHDLDLAILGDNINYGCYAANIRREYARFDEQAYKSGRTEMLHRLLERPFLYETEVFREMFEQDARRNLHRELVYWQSKNV